MIIDGVAASEAIDSSGEVLSISGMDISDALDGKCYINFEHKSQADDLVGIVVYAKKIFKKSDCENKRQEMFWEQTKMPMLYIKAKLFDKEGHIGAVCLAAIMRAFKKEGHKVQMGFSVEGSTLERSGNELQRSIIRKISATVRPCNKQAWADVLDDNEISKSNKHYLFTEIDADQLILEDDSGIESLDPFLDIKKALSDLNKTLTAGMGNVAPSQLVGGAALARESIDRRTKNVLKAVVRDWDRKRPLKETIKAALPEVSDTYIDHFTDIAEELALKKNKQTKLIRIGAKHSDNTHQTDEQKQLIEGLYMNPDIQQNPAFKVDHDEWSNAVYKLKNDAGDSILVKSPRIEFGKENAESSAHYHHLADKFFGMGNQVPVTNYFSHSGIRHRYPPTDGASKYQAMKVVDDTKTPLESEELWEKALSKARETGNIQKLAIMDHVMGMSDRHAGNLLIDKQNTIHHVDNDSAFRYHPNKPDHLADEDLDSDGVWTPDTPAADSLHPETAKWLMKLNPKDLAKMMYNMGMDHDAVRQAITGLSSYRKLAAKPMPFGRMWDVTQNAIAASGQGQVNEDPNR